MKIGIGKSAITTSEFGMAMLGYGRHDNIAKSIDADIYARAFVFEDADANISAIVNMEIAFPSILLKDKVLAVLQEKLPNIFTQDNLMITAQHTHSAPGGLTQYIFYNIPTPGFNQHVFDCYWKGTVTSIVEAYENRRTASINFNKGDFDLKEEVAFNRSVEAYNRNPDVQQKLTDATSNLGVDRTMKMLSFKDESGKLFGSMNWFGVHTTSLSNDNSKISADNKGFAAQYVEQEMGEGYLGAFLQDACGDVSPNYIYDKKKKWTRGKFEDDFESAKYNGRLQADKAKELLQQSGEKIDGNIKSITKFYDMGDVAVDEQYANGLQNQFSASPIFGISFLMGTKEGPGAPAILGKFVSSIFGIGKSIEKRTYVKRLSEEDKKRMARDYEMQGNKTLTVDAGRGRTFLVNRVKNLFFIPSAVDPLLGRIKKLDRRNVMQQTPWVPKVLPLQIMTIGSIAFIGLPMEITVVAAERLRASLRKKLAAQGIEHIQLCPYANSYAGYITTHQEYEEQAYEGGHTLFGKWTLAAFQSQYDALADDLAQLSKGATVAKTVQPVRYAMDEIWKGDL